MRIKPRTLLRFYPPAWRDRYGAEFVALLEREGTGPRVVMSVAAGAFDAWMSPKMPSEMALDGPFGPSVLLEQGNTDVDVRDRLWFIGLSMVVGAMLTAFAEVLQQTGVLGSLNVGIIPLLIGQQLVMPFLWLRYFSLRTRVAAAFWWPAFMVGGLLSLNALFRLAYWISKL